MRKMSCLAALLVAGCATAPERPAVVSPQQPAAQSGGLIGLTAAQLFQRFGVPAMQVREGAGLKLQFRGRCILDVYLYAPAGRQGPERVTHVDSRLQSGAAIDRQSCIDTFQPA